MNENALEFDPLVISLEHAKISPRGVLEIRGWAAGYSPVESIDILIAGQVVGHPDYGSSRPDVAIAYPEFANAASSGFELYAEINDTQIGYAEVEVSVTLFGGITRATNINFTIPPTIRRRQVNKDFIYNCENAILTEDGYVKVDGWAICPGAVSRITVLLDDIQLGAAKVGLLRPDVGNVHPTIASARYSGFSFETTITERKWTGEHILTLVVESKIDSSYEAIVPVRASDRLINIGQEETSSDLNDDVIRFNIDEPPIKDNVTVEKVKGALTVIGWALAKSGISNVAVFLDGALVGSAYYGIRRQDIQAAFPEWEGGLLSGYAITLPKRAFTLEKHQVRVVVTDNDNNIREREFTAEVEIGGAESDVSPLRSRIRQSEIDLKLRSIATAPRLPGITVGLIVGDKSTSQIDKARETINSLSRQCFPDFRLHLIGPASVIFGLGKSANQAGISVDVSANELEFLELSLAVWEVTGRHPFFLLLRAGDILGDDALLELALELATNPQIDFLYADERRYDYSQKELSVFLKPEWSPDLLLSTNYIGRPWCASRSLIRLARLRTKQITSRGEYDLVLRLTEHASHIRRAPLVLADRAGEWGDTHAQEVAALSRALRRRKTNGEVLRGCIPGSYRLKRRVFTKGMVSIIMPTIAARGLIKISVDSIRKMTSYRNFEIICIDNIYDQGSTWKEWLRQNADKVIEVLEPFNWSRFNNIGAKGAGGEFLLFLNDDIEILDKNWLQSLLEHAQLEGVGVVGPQLLYPDRRVQHAGIFLTSAGGRHAFRFSDENEPGPFGLALSQRNVSAVTGACMMMSRRAYEEVGGFNESHSVVNNDLDYCLQAWRAGQRVIYTPHTKLIHHELASRAKMDDVFDTSGFEADWRIRFLLGDPYFHPRLSLNDDNYVADQEPTRLVTTGHPILGRDKVRRILVQKLDHIGDFITALPAIRRLKERFPKAEIHVLVPKASMFLTHLEPSITNAIEFNFFHAVSGLGEREISPEELEELREKLSVYKFDMAIDLRKHGNTRYILRYSGAQLLAGFDYRGEQAWLDVAIEWEGDTGLTRKRSHVADEYIVLIEAVSTACESDRNVASRSMDRNLGIDALVSSPTIASVTRGLFTRPFVCIHPAAGNDARQWPPIYFAGLADLLAEKCDVNIVLIGAPSEEAVAIAVMDGVTKRDRIWNLVGKTGIRDVPNFIIASSLFIGNNSGPHHLAASLGVPTIGIHSGVVDAIEWGPLGPNSVALQKEMSCGPCYLPAAAYCHRSLACLWGLRPAEVFRQSLQFLPLRALDSTSSCLTEH